MKPIATVVPEVHSYEEVLAEGVTALAVLTSGKNLVRRGTTAVTGFWPMGRKGITTILVFLRSASSDMPNEVWSGDLIEAENTGKHSEGPNRSVTKFKFHLKNYKLVGVTKKNFATFCSAPGSSKQAIYLPRSERRNWLYEARKVWPILATLASQRRTAFYEDIAAYIATNPLSVRLALDPIQTYCMETGKPPLTAIVVSKTNGLPSKGFIAWDIDDIKEAHRLVFSYDWASITNPFGQLDSNDTTETLVNKLLGSKEDAQQVYAKVKSRGVFQSLFRQALIQIYEGKCAFCGLVRFSNQ
jgi:hypothetical protein